MLFTADGPSLSLFHLKCVKQTIDFWLSAHLGYCKSSGRIIILTARLTLFLLNYNIVFKLRACWHNVFMWNHVLCVKCEIQLLSSALRKTNSSSCRLQYKFSFTTRYRNKTRLNYELLSTLHHFLPPLAQFSLFFPLSLLTPLLLPTVFLPPVDTSPVIFPTIHPLRISSPYPIILRPTLIPSLLILHLHTFISQPSLLTLNPSFLDHLGSHSSMLDGILL